MFAVNLVLEHIVWVVVGGEVDLFFFLSEFLVLSIKVFLTAVGSER